MLDSTSDWKQRLAFNGRAKLACTAFSETDRLFRGFRKAELDPHTGQLDIDSLSASLKLPDLSCNWDRYSHPEDVRFRKPGCEREGCYSFTVAAVRFESYANAIHDPTTVEGTENYAHVEIRPLRELDTFEVEIPHGQTLKDNKSAKKIRQRWRTNIANNHRVECDAED